MAANIPAKIRQAGITPFVLPPRGADAAEKADNAEGEMREKVEGQRPPAYVSDTAGARGPVEAAGAGLSRTDSTSSASSSSSAGSETPLVLHIR